MLDSHLKVQTAPVALKENVILWRDYRVTVLGDRLFRVEKNRLKAFRDCATQSVWFRNMPKQDFSVEPSEEGLSIVTTDCTLVLKKRLADCRIVLDGKDIPYSDDLIEFISQGSLFVRGVGNGNPNSHESETDSKRRLFNGKCMALVSANEGEEAALKVQCKGLPDATVKFTLVRHEGLPLLNAAPNVTISDFTMSDIYNERPDPLVKIADNDFNSFIPINVAGSHQNDFHSGYRIYRTFITAPKGNKFEMNLINYVSDETEVYISGKCVYSEKNFTGSEKSVSFPVDLKTGDRVEVRILLFNRDAPYGGIRDGIKIVAE